MVDDTVDGRDNQKEDIMEVGDIMMYHFNQNHWASTPPCWRPSPPSPSCWCHEHWCCHTIWSSQTLLNAPTISTAYHTLTLIDWRIFKLKWYIMMSNGCPCHPQLQCLRPATLMTLWMSDMLKLEKHRKNCKSCPAQVSWKVKVKCQSYSACLSGLSRPFCLPCLYSLSCLPFCGFSFRR